MAKLAEIYNKANNSTESTMIKMFRELGNLSQLNTEDFGFKDLFIDASKDKVKVDGKKMSIEEFNDSYKNESGMSYYDAMKAAANAQTDDDVMEVINKLSEPAAMDRATARDTYNEYLGYDPTTYWDRSEIDDKLRQFEVDEGNPRSLVEAHDEIVNAAMTLFETNRDYTQSVAIKQALVMNDIDEDIVSSFDKIVQALAVDDDDDEDVDFGFTNEDESEDEEEESSIFDDDDSDDED